MRIRLLLVSLFCWSYSFSQGDMSLADFTNVNQSGYLNPALVPESEMSLGIPIASSLSFGGNSTAFAIKDFIYPHPDSGHLVVDPRNVYEAVSTKANFRLHTDHDWLSIGRKLSERSYVRFAIRERLNFTASLPYNLLIISAEGNAQGLLGEDLNFEGLAIDFSWYREVLFGYAVGLNDKISLGLNLKYIQGVSNLGRIRPDLNFYTEENFFDLQLTGDLSYRSTNMGMISSDSGISVYSKTPFWANNHGWGADLGIDVQVNEKFKIGMSLLDFGGISWKKSAKQVSTNFDTLAYSGVDLLELFAEGTGSTNTDVASFVSDSLTELLKLEEDEVNYKTSLPFSANLFFGYEMTSNSRVYSCLRTMKQPSFWLTALHVGYVRKFGESFEAGVNYTLGSNGGFNLGLKSSLELGPVQIFVLSDNIIGTFLPQNARYWSTRAGINIIR